MGLGPSSQAEEAVIKMSIEDALASAETMSTEAFISQSQRMAFHVRTDELNRVRIKTSRSFSF